MAGVAGVAGACARGVRVAAWGRACIVVIVVVAIVVIVVVIVVIVVVIVIVVIVVIYTKRVSITRYPSLCYARGLETIVNSYRLSLLVEYHPNQCRQ